MKKIFNDACDKNVSVRVVYVDEAGDLFYDEECTVEVPAEDCLNLFVKGVVAIKDDVYYTAVSCTDEGVIDFNIPSA